jgi:competence protein ComEC
MADRWGVGLALATFAGALVAKQLPLAVALATMACAWLLRSPPMLCVACMVLASCLAARAWEGLDHPPLGPIGGTATLTSDPVLDDGDIEADARIGGRRLRLTVPEHLMGAADFREALAGERVVMRGVVRVLEPWEEHLRARHIAARVTVSHLGTVAPGDLVHDIANRARRTLTRGAEALPDRQRPIFLGMVLGDDRGQAVDIADDFRAAGLGHLLAVSGQNVALLLALLQPLRRRLRLGPRFVVTVLSIGFFTLLTRFEPSVLRASAMATVAVLATTTARHVHPSRALALAVTVIVLLDPLVVHVLGFQLSVAASTAIIVLSPRLARALPGPRMLRDALAVTLAAQLGVAPLLLTTFGPVPLAAVPANLLAVPAAGLVMVWGLPAGFVAGLVSPLAGVLHTPTRVLIAWILGVARGAALAPLDALGATSILVLTVGTAATFAVRGHIRGRIVVPVAAAVIAVAVVVPDARPAVVVVGVRDIAFGAELWHGSEGGTVVVLSEVARAEPVLAALRGAQTREIDVVVALGARAEIVDAVRHRHRGAVLFDRHGKDETLNVGGVEIARRSGRVDVRLGVGSAGAP